MARSSRPTLRYRQGGDACSAVFCSNARYKKDRGNISFFRFPRDEERSAKWVQNSRRKDLHGKTAAQLHKGGYFLCSKHFEASQFTVPSERKRLNWNAVPTIFEVPNPPPRLTPSRPLPKKRRGSFEQSPQKRQNFSQPNQLSNVSDAVASSERVNIPEVKVEIDIAEDPLLPGGYCGEKQKSVSLVETSAIQIEKEPVSNPYFDTCVSTESPDLSKVKTECITEDDRIQPCSYEQQSVSCTQQSFDSRGVSEVVERADPNQSKRCRTRTDGGICVRAIKRETEIADELPHSGSCHDSPSHCQSSVPSSANRNTRAVQVTEGSIEREGRVTTGTARKPKRRDDQQAARKRILLHVYLKSAINANKSVQQYNKVYSTYMSVKKKKLSLEVNSVKLKDSKVAINKADTRC